jgi:hypothetical protein
MLLLAGLILTDAGKFIPLEPSEEYTHELVIDEDNPSQYKIFWKILNNTNEILIEAHCQTTGWMGLGFSPNGGMANADIVIGWVDGNSLYLKVCFFKLSLIAIISNSNL